MASFTDSSKHVSTNTNAPIGSSLTRTWDNTNYTWDQGDTATWNDPGDAWIRSAKHVSSQVNQTKD